MGIALQLLFTGLGIGSIYALVALGFVLIYRATNVVNFAQGDFAMLGAFSMVVLCVDLELPYWLGILITLVAMLVFGALFNLAVYYPLRNRGFRPESSALSVPPFFWKTVSSPRMARDRRPYQVSSPFPVLASAQSFSIVSIF
jgi:branched-subunit amino acid ABC-type transport system permease component